MHHLPFPLLSTGHVDAVMGFGLGWGFVSFCTSLAVNNSLPPSLRVSSFASAENPSFFTSTLNVPAFLWISALVPPLPHWSVTFSPSTYTSGYGSLTSMTRIPPAFVGTLKTIPRKKQRRESQPKHGNPNSGQNRPASIPQRWHRLRRRACFLHFLGQRCRVREVLERVTAARPSFSARSSPREGGLPHRPPVWQAPFRPPLSGASEVCWYRRRLPSRSPATPRPVAALPPAATPGLEPGLMNGINAWATSTGFW